MRRTKVLAAAVLPLLAVAACQKSPKLSPQVVAQTEAQLEVPVAAVEQSPYRNYRWMTDQEMINSRIGFDPTMSPDTRYLVERAINDDLAQKGYVEGQPADFIVAFNDTYIDRNRSDPYNPFLGPTLEDTGGVGGSTMEAYSDMEVYRTPEEAYSILFFDAKTHRLLWRGHGREHFATMAETQSNEAIEVAIYHALDPMPVPLILPPPPSSSGTVPLVPSGTGAVVPSGTGPQ